MPKPPPKPVALPISWQAAMDDHIIALAWSPDGHWLAVAEVSGPIALFDAATGARRWRIDGHGLGTTALAWRPDGGVLCSAGQDGGMRWWAPESGEELLRLSGGAAWVEHLAWTPGDRNSGPLLASGAGRKLRLWDGDGRKISAFGDMPATISALCWVPGLTPADPGPPLLATAAGATLSFWLPDRAEPVVEHQSRGPLLALAWRPDRRVIAGGKQDASVQTWTFPEQSDLAMHGYETKVRELAWDATSSWLATGGATTAIIWDWRHGTPEGSTPLYLDGHLDLVSVLAFQHCGPWLASGSLDGRAYLWNPALSEYLHAYTRLTAEVSTLVWAPDDQLLAIGAADGAVRVCAVRVLDGRPRSRRQAGGPTPD